MRISVSMLRRLSAGILVSIVILLLSAVPVSADTGTYEILDYVVTMEPQNDGRVLMTFEQQWKVLSGSIPWVTVGLPNNNFEIKSSSGDVAGISNGSGSGFYGVRVDLTRDFYPGSVFNIKFTVLQGKILERLTSESLWRIAYTPGWYDRASIGHLQVNLISPVEYTSYTTVSPLPAVTGKTLTWEVFDVNPGGRLNISVSSSDGSFLTVTEPAPSGGKSLGTGFWVIIGIIVAIGLLVVWRIRQGRKEQEVYIQRKATSIQEEMAKDPLKKQAVEEDFKEYVEKKGLEPDVQGRYYDRSFGSYITPAIWWAIILNQQSRNTPPASGVTKSNPGCVHSCACVSCACACACACAGGGAAGCSRKTLHDFRQSQTKTEEKTGAENS